MMLELNSKEIAEYVHSWLEKIFCNQSNLPLQTESCTLIKGGVANAT